MYSARTAQAAHVQMAGVPEAYRLRAVGHSLGGASLLIYLVMCRRARRPHHLYRLILLTPAGFLSQAPKVSAHTRTHTHTHMHMHMHTHSVWWLPALAHVLTSE